LAIAAAASLQAGPGSGMRWQNKGARDKLEFAAIAPAGAEKDGSTMKIELVYCAV